MQNFWQTLPKPIITLAPMAGYTDSAFRLLCRQMGAQVVYSEMISVDAICHKNKKTLDMFKFDKKECPVVFQLFGNKPDRFKQAIKIINKSLVTNYKLQITGLDLNFGCPAHKVYKTGAGAALMDELDTAYDIIQTACQNTVLPISVKIRTKVNHTTAIDFVKKIKQLPFSAVMIHGRTLNQGFAGHIDFEIIKKIKQLLPDKIVLANGGINHQADIELILAKTNADGVGIARGALGNPWIFQPKNQETKLSPTQKRSQPKNQKNNSIILKHAKLFLKSNDNLIPLRKHLVHYAKGLPNASNLRQQLIHVTTLEELEKILS